MIQYYGDNELSDEVLDTVNAVAESLGCTNVIIETINGSAKIRFESPFIPDTDGWVGNIDDISEWEEMLNYVVMSTIDWIYESKEESTDYGNREETFTA